MDKHIKLYYSEIIGKIPTLVDTTGNWLSFINDVKREKWKIWMKEEPVE
jgi:hypothetical protein